MQKMPDEGKKEFLVKAIQNTRNVPVGRSFTFKIISKEGIEIGDFLSVSKNFAKAVKECKVDGVILSGKNKDGSNVYEKVSNK